MSGDEQGYQGWANWDTWETWLLLTNTQSTYNWLVEWNKNFKRKVKRGIFDQELAESVVRKYIVPVARGKGMAKRFSDFTPDPNINPDNVDAGEIVKAILELDE